MKLRLDNITIILRRASCQIFGARKLSEVHNAVSKLCKILNEHGMETLPDPEIKVASISGKFSLDVSIDLDEVLLAIEGSVRRRSAIVIRHLGSTGLLHSTGCCLCTGLPNNEERALKTMFSLKQKLAQCLMLRTSVRPLWN